MTTRLTSKLTGGHFQLIVKHYDKPGILATILDVIRDGSHEPFRDCTFAIEITATKWLVAAQNRDLVRLLRAIQLIA